MSMTPTQSKPPSPKLSPSGSKGKASENLNLDVEFVAAPSSGGLSCPICKRIFSDPVILSGCGHSFCRSCIEPSIESDKSCPLCRSRTGDDLKPNLALATLVNDLEVYCSNRTYGCLETVRLEHLQDHLAVCSKKPSKCNWSQWGCDFAGDAGMVVHHLEQCPYQKLKGFIQLYDSKINMLEQRLAELELNKSVAPSRPLINKNLSHVLDTGSADDVSVGVVDDTWPNGDVECRRTISEHRTGVTALSYHDGSIFSGAYDGSIKVFNAESGQMVRNLHGHELSVWALAVSDDGRRLFSAGSDGTINAWDISAHGDSSEFVEHTNKDHVGKVYSLVVLGDRLISASSDKTLKVWDMNLTCLATLEGHEDGINSLCLFKNGQVVSASSDKTLRIWDLQRGQSIKTVACPSEALSVCYSPEDNLLFSSHYDATINAYNGEDCRRVETLIGHSWEVWQLQHTDVGHCLFSGSFDHNIKRWDTRMFECTATLRGHKAFVHALALGNKNLISGCADRTIKIWR